MMFMPRIARSVAVDYPHHVTQRGNNRSTIFFDDEDHWFYINTLKRYSQKYKLEIWAYCLMGNHVHLLVVPKEDNSLARGIGLTNMVYTQYLNRRLGNSGRVWQNRFFSCAVEKETYLWSVARYIERNPVKAGILEKAEEYRWSSARAHLLNRPDQLLSGEQWLDEATRNDYKAFIEEDSEEAEKVIRQRTSSGRPLGGDEFICLLESRYGYRLKVGKKGRPKKEIEGK
jgi:putative transposase